jgi:hypothetical protein
MDRAARAREERAAQAASNYLRAHPVQNRTFDPLTAMATRPRQVWDVWLCVGYSSQTQERRVVDVAMME